MTESKTEAVDIAFVEGEELSLRFTFGPGRLRISPGAASPWVVGNYRDEGSSLPLKITQQAGAVRIAQSYGLPRSRKRPELEVQLGTAQSYALTIEAGANEQSVCDIGGLPITRFDAKHGAGEFKFDVSAPNPVEMTQFHLASGAADVQVTNLANANAASFAIEGGAAAFVLDFGGTLQRDAVARISTGMASVEISVPATTAAKIFCNTVLGAIDAGDGFVTKEGGFWTMAAIAGDTPLLTVDASVTLGSLKLRTT